MPWVRLCKRFLKVYECHSSFDDWALSSLVTPFMYEFEKQRMLLSKCWTRDMLTTKTTMRPWIGHDS